MRHDTKEGCSIVSYTYTQMQSEEGGHGHVRSKIRVAYAQSAICKKILYYIIIIPIWWNVKNAIFL